MTEYILKVEEAQSVNEIQKEGDAGQKEMMEEGAPSSNEQKITDSEKKKSQSENKSTSSKKYHTVKSGDTLTKIAAKNKTTVSKICKLNNIKESKTLHVGEKIRVR